MIRRKALAACIVALIVYVMKSLHRCITRILDAVNNDETVPCNDINLRVEGMVKN